ncbi:thiolase family protein [Myxococcota bacterium]|nr:thiolase family protein [Myxococcota bacterium]MCZ7619859.1 thiolase family protein [Myxococcota bacterium]
MSRRAVLAGVGHTEFGKLAGRSAWHLEAAAAAAAVADAGVQPRDIDGLLTDPGPAQGVLDGITPHFLRLGAQLGLDPDYAGSEILGGAGSVAIVERAVLAVEAGLCELCLCVYGDSALSAPGSFAYGRGDEAAFGFFGAVGLHALAARRHMHRYGTRTEHLGEVAIAARSHAARTPHAQKRQPIEMQDYLASEFLVEPLRKLDCCLVSDGAAAVLVTTEERAGDLRCPPIRILGHAQAHSLSTYASSDHFDRLPAARCGPKALGRAGLAPADIDVALLYDCFTIVVLLQLEDYGFCKKGESGAFVEGGRIAPGGSLPVNPSGGLLAEGYGGGMLHVIEAVRQLRGEAGERQVAGAETALVSGHGLGMNTHATLVLGS